MLMPEVFSHPESFINSIDHEGHKQYYLLTLKAYIQSLIDLDNLFRRQLLPTTVNASHGDDVNPSSISLEGNQTIVYNFVKQMITLQENFLASFGQEPCTTSDVNWQSFLLILGKPGTGKTFTAHKCIQYCVENNLSIAVAVPTGTVACTYRKNMKTL